jgi:hypothetical protein
MRRRGETDEWLLRVLGADLPGLAAPARPDAAYAGVAGDPPPRRRTRGT